MTTNKTWLGALAAGLLLAGGAEAQTTQSSQLASAQTSTAQPQVDTISRSAASYGTFQTDVSDIKSKPFASAGDVDKALTNLGGHNAKELSSGWIAYSALIASQNPDYRAAVRDIESFYGRDVLETGLRNDVRYARTLAGGNDAVLSSITAVRADSRRIDSAAAYVKEQAYSLQGSGWAKAKIGNSGAKADQLNSAASVGRPAAQSLIAALSSPDANAVFSQAGAAGAPSLWDGMTTAATSIRLPAIRTSYASSASRIAPGKEPVADRIATLAAYRVIGASATSSSSIHTAMSERDTSNCLKTAHLNLQQCVAAAHQQYEVPFCIGEHALSDVGKCIGDVSR